VLSILKVIVLNETSLYRHLQAFCAY
jgi:hypothetical protein